MFLFRRHDGGGGEKGGKGEKGDRGRQIRRKSAIDGDQLGAKVLIRAKLQTGFDEFVQISQ